MTRIIVTGARGGTGCGIVQVLREIGHHVTGVDLQPSDGHDPNYVQLDLLDAAGTNDVFAGADSVIHFGSPPKSSRRIVFSAQPLPRRERSQGLR